MSWMKDTLHEAMQNNYESTTCTRDNFFKVFVNLDRTIIAPYETHMYR